MGSDRLPAGDRMAGRELDERRLLDAFLEGEWTAGPESTTARWVEQGRRVAWDAGQMLVGVAHPDLGQRREEHPRIGMPRRLDDHPGGGFLGQLPGNITVIVSAI